MRVTLRALLKVVRTALKKSLTERDKWIKEWPGQMCITSSQVCKYSLKRYEGLKDLLYIPRKLPELCLSLRDQQSLDKCVEYCQSHVKQKMVSSFVMLIAVSEAGNSHLQVFKQTTMTCH